MLVVTVEFLVRPERASAFRAAVMQQAANTLREEPACRRFDVCIDTANQSAVFLYEIYDDREAFDAHLGADYFRDFDRTTRGWLEQKTVRTWHGPLEAE